MIRDRGWRIVRENVERLGVVGLKPAQILFPSRYKNPRDFAERIGLGLVSSKRVKEVQELLNLYWENLQVVLIRVPDEIGQLALISKFFEKYELSIVANISATKWGDTFRLEFRLDKSDPRYDSNKVKNLVDDICDYFSKKYVNWEEDWVLCFENDTAYQEWKKRYQITSTMYTDEEFQEFIQARLE